MIRPDRREILYYDINSFLLVDPDSMRHYWSTLIDKFQMLEDLSDDEGVPFCITCGSYDHITYPDGEDGPPACMFRHDVVTERTSESIRRMIDTMLDALTNSNGYRMTLFDLEIALARGGSAAFIETREYGDVSLMQVRKTLYKVKRLIVTRLADISAGIYFMSQMRVPAVSMR